MITTGRKLVAVLICAGIGAGMWVGIIAGGVAILRRLVAG
jgi:hypothetical protein